MTAALRHHGEPTARSEVAPPELDARQITNADGLAQLVLDDKVYTLRITRQGKLILTK
jgi:hemin uptake protein HemP